MSTVRTSFDKAALLAEADALLRKPDFSKEDKARCDSLIALADASGPEGRTLKLAKMAATELELGIRSNENAGASKVEKEFREFLVHGSMDLLSDTSRMAIAEGRAQGVGSGSIGGYVVPQSFVDTMESSLIATDPLFAVATQFETKTGSAFVHPEVDDQGVAAAIVAENSQSTAGPDIAFPAGITWDKTPTWRSGVIRASLELANDSQFDLSQVVAKASGVRMARGIGAAFVTQLLSDSVSGLTSASATAVTGDELINLMSSVDSAYSANGSWMMRFSTYANILKLKGSTSGDYLFPAMLAANGRPALLGFPVYLSPAMPALAASQTAISFGDHSRFYRRQVANSLSVRVYAERYAEYLQVGYETFWRVDGHLMKAPDYGSPAVSQSPVKFITQHS